MSSMGAQSSSHGGPVKPRVPSSKFTTSSSTNNGGRPSSAPNKRPPSPSTNAHNNSHDRHHSGSGGQPGGSANNSASATGAANSSSATSAGHNRVKYTKGKQASDSHDSFVFRDILVHMKPAPKFKSVVVKKLF